MKNTDTNGWEDGDVLPKLKYVDHKEWNESPSTGTFAYDPSRPQLMVPGKINFPDLTTTFSEADLSIAMTMTIVPMYVRYDHQFLPNTTFSLVTDPEYPDYPDFIPDPSLSSWSETLASEPISGGDWLHHIVIAHRAQGGADCVTSVIR